MLLFTHSPSPVALSGSRTYRVNPFSVHRLVLQRTFVKSSIPGLSPLFRRSAHFPTPCAPACERMQRRILAQQASICSFSPALIPLAGRTRRFFAKDDLSSAPPFLFCESSHERQGPTTHGRFVACCPLKCFYADVSLTPFLFFFFFFLCCVGCFFPFFSFFFFVSFFFVCSPLR